MTHERAPAAAAPAPPPAAVVPAPPPESVIGKVRLILDVLGTADEPLGLSSISRASGIPKTTVSRLCAELVEWGVVDRARYGFTLGPRLSELGARAPVRRALPLTRDDLRVRARPFLVELFTITHMPANISVLSGGDVLCIDKISGLEDGQSWVQDGTRFPAHCTASGKALLAFSHQEVLDALFAGPLHRATRYSLHTPRLLYEQLHEIRQTHLAFARDETKVGMSSLAAPVLDRDGIALAALAVGSDDHTFEPRVCAAIRRQADRLARSLQSALHAV